MFDIGWTELLVIGVVALIVIGPKDLPDMFRTMGRFTAKARSMARDFQRAMEQAADDTGVKDVANDLKGVASPRSLGLEKVKEAVTKFEKWDPMKPEPKPVTTAQAAPTPAAAAVTPPGPATQALIDEKAEQRARHAAAVSALTKPAPVSAVGPVPAAPTPAATPAPAAAAATKPAPKPKAARPAPAPKDPIGKAVAAAQGDAPKPVRKPRAKKADAGKDKT